MPTVKDDAICIRHWDWSETSQTVSLLTREHGIVRGLAKGARRENAAFSGGIELLTRGEVMFILKASGKEQATLSTLTAWDLQEPRSALRRSLAHLHAGMFLIDLVHHSLHEFDPHPAVFAALDAALGTLGEGAAPQRVISAFLWQLLADTGYRPEVWADPRTGAEITAGAVYSFSPRLGGLVNNGGAGKVRTSGEAPQQIPAEGSERAALPEDEIWKVRSDTVGVLRMLAAGKETVDLAAFVVDTRFPDEAIVRSTALLASYFRFIHRTWPPSIRWVLPGQWQR